MNILKILDNVPVQKLAWALRSYPEAWNKHTFRTMSPASPHHQVDDIYVRYGKEPDSWKVPHESIWYELPRPLMDQAQAVITVICSAVGAIELGGVLITRIPPGKEVKPHKDSGWHAEYYEKFAVQIESAPGQKFCFDGEHLESKPGDVYWFCNQAEHWVVNPTCYERTTMIICARR